MATTISDAGTDKVFARVSAELKDEIEKRAESLGQKSGEWIRETLATAIEADRDDTRRRHETADQFATLIEGRFDRLEERIFDENSAILKLGFELLIDLAHLRAEMSEVHLAREDLTPNKEKERRDHIEQEAMTYFFGRKETIFASIKRMRDDARSTAEASTSLPDQSEGSS